MKNPNIESEGRDLIFHWRKYVRIRLTTRKLAIIVRCGLPGRNPTQENPLCRGTREIQGRERGCNDGKATFIIPATSLTASILVGPVTIELNVALLIRAASFENYTDTKPRSRWTHKVITPCSPTHNTSSMMGGYDYRDPCSAQSNIYRKTLTTAFRPSIVLLEMDTTLFQIQRNEEKIRVPIKCNFLARTKEEIAPSVDRLPETTKKILIRNPLSCPTCSNTRRQEPWGRRSIKLVNNVII